MITNSIERSQAFFLSRDRADAQELTRDTTVAISTAVSRGEQRLWIITNVNQKVIEMVGSNLDPKALSQLGLSVTFFQDKTGLREELEVKANREDIPTLIVESFIKGANKKLYFE